MIYIRNLIFILIGVMIISCSRNFEEPFQDTSKDIRIESVALSDTTSTSVKVIFYTTDFGTTVINYGTSSNYGLIYIDTTMVKEHIATLNNLSAQTTYHIQVKSRNKWQNVATSNTDISFTTKPEDTTAPVISNILITPSYSSVHISWQTDDPAKSTILFGTSMGNYDQTFEVVEDFSISHSIEISDLSENTTYHFVISVTNPSGLNSISSDNSFTTLENVFLITNIQVSGITSSGAVISWTTTKPCRGVIEYGDSIAGWYEYSTTIESENVLQHSVELDSLKPQTIYHWRINALEPNGVQHYSNDSTFTTFSSPYLEAVPEFSSLSVGEIGIVNIYLRNARDISTASYKVDYNSNIISVLSVMCGDFGDNTFFLYSLSGSRINIDQSWYINYEGGVPNNTNATGDGVIAKIKVKGMLTGTSGFGFDQIVFLSITGNEISQGISQNTSIIVNSKKKGE